MKDTLDRGWQNDLGSSGSGERINTQRGRAKKEVVQKNGG